METQNHRAASTGLARLVPAIAALAFTLALAACGGGGVVPSTSVAAVDANGSKSRTQTPEWAEYVSRKAVAYSPYRSNNRDTETVTEAMVLEDLKLLEQGDFRLIRLFDSNDKVALLTLDLIRREKLDIKVHLGAYILSESSPYISDELKQAHKTHNEAEVKRAVALANDYSDIVLAVSVGNETMVSWSIVPSSPAIMAAYITSVRSRIKQPVTTDDNSKWYATAPKIITDAIDFASIHTYPGLDTKYPVISWDWHKTDAASMMATFIAKEKEYFADVRAYLDMKGQAVMPIVIGESGWNAVNLGQLGYRAHPVNQKMFYQAMEKWMREAKTSGGPANFIYFEAFDEPWKEGDDKWGLFTVGRKARYVIQGLYPQSLWDEPGKYSAADALHWQPISNHKVTADRYTVYAESFVLNEDRPWWVATPWDSTASMTELDCRQPPATTCPPGAAPPDGFKSSQITPLPRSWGWGVPFELKESDLVTNTSADLSDFASGSVNFSIRTLTPGMIEVGFVTGRYTDSSENEVFMPLAPGEFGYLNDGAWHQVSIPLSELLARAGGVGPRGQTTNPKEVTAFVIADRYAKTGKALNSNIKTPIEIDAIYLQR